MHNKSVKNGALALLGTLAMLGALDALAQSSRPFMGYSVPAPAAAPVAIVPLVPHRVALVPYSGYAYGYAVRSSHASRSLEIASGRVAPYVAGPAAWQPDGVGGAGMRWNWTRVDLATVVTLAGKSE